LKSTATHTSCYLCNSKSISELHGYEKHHLAKCQTCGFVFSTAVPSEAELIAFYSQDYDRTDYFSPITEKRYNELLDTFEPYRKTGKLLDIGCGYGFFLETAKKRGWEVHGTEVSEEACEKCTAKGIQMHCGKFELQDFQEEFFDIIVSFEVIEHLQNPQELLTRAHQALRKGGLFYLTTPNFNSYLRRRLGPSYDVIDYPNHLSYYTPKTLTKLFTKNGYRTLKVRTTGISVTRLKTSKGASKQQYVSETSDDEMLRYKIEKRRFYRILKHSTNFVLNLFGVGVSLKGWFVKK
jgi:2-polyprenyl-3-methyl-5-hydroxy-6-metoxy-1,4-benzoquinol methylase